MKYNNYFAIEAIVLAAPAVSILAWGVFMTALAIMFVGIEGIKEQSLLNNLIGATSILGACFSLAVLSNLIIKTIKNQRYMFGFGFWMAILFGGVATNTLYELTSLTFTVFIVAPLIVLIIHFSIIQTLKMAHS